MSAATKPSSRRIGYYLQAHYYQNDRNRYLSMLPLGDPKRHTSFVVLAAFHLNYTKDDGAGLQKIYLNDEIYDEGLNVTVWEEAEQLQKQGIKISGLLGGNGIWETEKLGGIDGYDRAYRLIADMIRAKKLDGIELNVEPHDEDPSTWVGNDGVIRVITQLKSDFPHLLITMTPGGRELLPGQVNLSNVDYMALYKTMGHEIEWFNLQCYNGWGHVDIESFQSYVDVGYPADKLVMLVLSGPSPDPQVRGWIDGEELRDGLHGILTSYPDMGGVGCWDWFNATTEADGKPVMHPEIWSDFVSAILFPNSS